MDIPISSGPIERAQKVVIYGPEGIGKTTLAAAFPDPLFLDLEGGTSQLDTKRLPRPRTWTDLLAYLAAVASGEVLCKTIVIDTADEAERMCCAELCTKNGWESIESPGYGKGFTQAAEKFQLLLESCREIVELCGINVVLVSHAMMRKFERPDESGAYDRFELKLSKKVAPLVKEWCDMLLFCDYEIDVLQDSKTKKYKARGGKRVIRTTHAPTWDAKNRFGLADVLPLEFASIAECIPGGKKKAEPKKKAGTKKSSKSKAKAKVEPEASDGMEGWPDRMGKLRDLMRKDGVAVAELQDAMGRRGTEPAEKDPTDYPQEEVDWLVKVWESFRANVEAARVPFD